MNENRVKILFRFYSNLLDEWTVETMWATKVDEEKKLFKIDNIPFYASISCDDIVFAEYDETEAMLTYREAFEYSGNSTVQVIMMDKTVEINDVRDIFNKLGCESEKANYGYFVLNIPAAIDYKLVKEKLSKLQEKGIVDYAESCLSENHWY
jgi:hypothetical protein